MKLFITSDSNTESGVGEATRGLAQALGDYFADRRYNDSDLEIAICLMCRDPRWNFKQRIRFVKKENCLYMDIMLDLDVMKYAERSHRKEIIGSKIVSEVPEIIAKKKFKDFDLPRFTKDLREWFEDNGWIAKDFPEFIGT
ncbi:MAG: hypothetical protein JSS77_10735 [Acidobacteria bacterium]|nr:hypothetical protein [Acidobacteriota bacterium]HMM80997.1 hypothetical protein [Pyrinomonadaceae bacterium]